MDSKQKHMEKKIIKTFAFENWYDGGNKVSALYKGKEALDFIDDHYRSGTYATLHVFNDVHAALKSYNEYCDEAHRHHGKQILIFKGEEIPSELSYIAKMCDM